MREPLKFSYDFPTDVLTVEGIRYSGALFRALGFRIPPHGWLRIEERRDGMVTAYEPTEKEAHAIHEAIRSTTENEK